MLTLTLTLTLPLPLTQTLTLTLIRYFPQPEAFLADAKARGVHSGLNLHFQSGLVRGEDSFEVRG